MLTPEELKRLPDNIVEMYQELEDSIIEDICRRIGKTGGMTETARQQLAIVADMRADMNDISDRISQVSDTAANEAAAIMSDALERSVSVENEMYKAAGKGTVPLSSPMLQGLLQNGIRQTQRELKNFTQSLGFAMPDGSWQPIAEVYQKQLDKALMRVLSGAVDKRTAVRDAVNSLSGGLSWVDYKTGRRNRLDVAVERAIRTGTNQMCTRGTDALMDELGAEYVETTAHAGARPTHEVWQGRVFKVDGSDSDHDNFFEATGYGDVAGLAGANCRHSYYPFFPGISVRTYSDKQLREIDPPPFEYEGKTYSFYEATQTQRRIERNMRTVKRQLIGYDAAELRQDFQNASIKLQRMKQDYISFSRAAGLPYQLERAQVAGYGRSVAQASYQSAVRYHRR
jgi:hypothetical protein